ncbi:Hsp20/alpha crystallin family protein [Yeosuana sp. MJ-SS3]|uniref:Hsp20/alpha crystallin family protein n=1 Tax=Gilvirhabdus luticola TaxID=3079858 RepID=A0ABU3U5M0_9FLAO|nr:Hsp20/alpha crystallin family protein [Yeosuana sp. MJ-SS3]MDU8885707.1 Hsp20/alpha crystallin family protein [Yeosuana sp. MJ-SS3]
MTTLIKRKNRNRLLTPRYERMFTPWTNNFFPFKNDAVSSLLNFEDPFNGDFIDEESLLPAMNVKEHKNDFAIEFAAPGFTKNDFEVSIEDNVLHVEGEKSEKEKVKEEDFTRKEFNYKSFKRSIALPESVDLNQKIKATYKDGILNVKLLKKEEAVKGTSKKVIEIA